MNPTIDPHEKIEIVPETVASTEQPFGYEAERTKDLPLPKPAEANPEPVGLGLVSVVSALALPIIVALLWSSVRVNVVTPEAAEGAASYTVSTIILFLLLIFIVPVSTIFSLITAYLTFKRSQKIGRWVAAGSWTITAAGFVLLMFFLNTLQSAANTVT